jgi:hypothetical protein
MLLRRAVSQHLSLLNSIKRLHLHVWECGCYVTFKSPQTIWCFCEHHNICAFTVAKNGKSARVRLKRRHFNIDVHQPESASGTHASARTLLPVLFQLVEFEAK